MPLPLTLGTGRSLLAQDRVQAFKSLLKRYATYAWWGPDATLTGWVDCVSGVNAASGGSGTTLGNLNGVPCPVLDGGGWFAATLPTSISRPFSLVFVILRTGTATSAFPVLFDVNSIDFRFYATDGGGSTPGYMATVAATGIGVPNVAAVGSAVVIDLRIADGVGGCVLRRNGVQIDTGDNGAIVPAFSSITIGARTGYGTTRFSGSIALATIISGDATSVTAAAGSLIGV